MHTARKGGSAAFSGNDFTTPEYVHHDRSIGRERGCE
jgi:hypothetical protein